MKESLELSYMVAEARFEEAIYETFTGKFLFSAEASGTLESRVEEVIQNHPYGSHSVMFIAAACLQLYIQANWTGPPVASFSNAERYPLPCFSRESDLLHDADLVAKLEYYAKSQSAATGKDKTMQDIDPFPKTNAANAKLLEVNGEEVFDSLIFGIHFLHVSNVLLTLLGTNRTVTGGWWTARMTTAWQESLNTRDVASDLKLRCEAGFKSTYEKLAAIPARQVPGTTLGLLSMERGVAMHKFQDPNQAKRFFRQAMLDELQMDIQLSGAMGKRTKFQIEAKTQLILTAKSTDPTRTNAKDDAPIEPVKTEVVEPQTEGEAIGFGTMLEAGHVRVAIHEVDQDTPLHERIQFENEDRRTGDMRLIDQVLVLNLCIDVKNSAAMELLTAEQMLAYVDLVMLRPENFSIHACALLIKSKLEFEKYKTKERSVLQMQLLVDQQSNRLTPLQPTINKDENLPLERLEYIHALVWPPVWRLKRSLADRYQSVGVNMSALNLYQELRIWDDAVHVLLRMEKRHRAEQLIREQPKMTPNLLVILGELLDDEQLMHQAWEESNHRFARAKRLLGTRAFDRKDFASAKQHYKQALEINALFPSVWFKLGLIAFREKDYGQARVAYAELVRIEPEDSEAWANLSACMYAQNELEAALNASVEATKHARGNTKLWHNQLTLAIQLKQLDLAMECVNELIDLEGKHSGQPHVEVNAMLALTEHAIERPKFRNRYEQLLQKIKAKCTSQADIWVLAAEYYSASQQWALKEDALLRRTRCFLATPEWHKEDNLVKRLVLTSIVLCQDAIKHGDRTSKQNIYTFIKGFLSKIPPAIDKLDHLNKVWTELNSN